MTSESSDLNADLRNMARGGKKYWAIRSNIYATIINNARVTGLTPLNDYLSKSLFSLDDTWKIADINPEDRRILDRLRSPRAAALSDPYITLATNYVVANADAVRALQSRKAAIESSLFDLDVDRIDAFLTDFTSIEKASLLFLRTYSALLSYAPAQLVEELAKTGLPTFVRQLLLYPLIYYYINLPPDDGINTHISYVIPDTTEHAIDRAIVQLFINDELPSVLPPASKAYLALLTHPYDAREILLSHIEEKTSRGQPLSRAEIDCLTALHNTLHCFRSDYLISQIQSSTREYDLAPSNLAIFKRYDTSAEVTSYFSTFFSLTHSSSYSGSHEIVGYFHNMRSTRYPNGYDYDQISALLRRYWFTDFGRFTRSVLTSLYLLPRRPDRESIQALRLREYIGVDCPFLLCAPGANAFGAVSSAVLDALPDPHLPPAIEGVADRSWIKFVHWSLQHLEKNFQLRSWMDVIRRNIPVAPEYLTGISWQWVDGVVRNLRIKPFRGNPDGVYVLLLRTVELRQIDNNVLRTAIEPFALAARNFETFINHLSDEFQAETIAFLRYFLTPSMILRLRLSDNYIQALSLRMRAIEDYIAKHGYGRLITPEQYQQELQAFSTELLLINVGANHFEISWEIFRTNTQIKLEDMYRALSAFKQRSAELPSLLTLARTIYPYQFVNGVQTTYSIPNKDLPSVSLCCAIIDSFLQHASQGIEAILSVRIRHTNFRRQFVEAFERLQWSGGPAFVRFSRNGYLEKFRRAVTLAAQEWVDKYIHQTRVDKPDGIFCFTPLEIEMRDIISGADPASFETFISGVIDWMKRRLDRDLAVARARLTGDFRNHLSALITEIADSLEVNDAAVASEISLVSGTIQTTMHELIDNLTEWFRSSAYSDQLPATPQEMKMVLTGRYRGELDRKRLRISMRVPTDAAYKIQTNKVRLAFDLCCEIVDNALKYGETPRVTVSIKPYRDHQFVGYTFSSSAPIETNTYERTVNGHPYDTLGLAVFREGNSGLDKIAALAASILGETVSVSVIRRRRAFHVTVPFARSLVDQCQ